MIILALILISSVLFLAGFLKLSFPNSTKKLLLQLKNTCSLSPTPTLHQTSSSLSSTKNVEKHDGGLKQVFDTFDKNGDGFITRHELHQSLSNVGFVVPTKEVEEMVDKLDCNRDGLIDLGEFQELFGLMKGKESEKCGEGKRVDDNDHEVDLKEAFDVFDGDNDGLITVDELKLVLSSMGLKEGQREEDCKEMIKKVDVDGDGMVSFHEFKKMMIASPF